MERRYYRGTYIPWYRNPPFFQSRIGYVAHYPGRRKYRRMANVAAGAIAAGAYYYSRRSRNRSLNYMFRARKRRRTRSVKAAPSTPLMITDGGDYKEDFEVSNVAEGLLHGRTHKRFVVEDGRLHKWRKYNFLDYIAPRKTVTGEYFTTLVAAENLSNYFTIRPGSSTYRKFIHGGRYRWETANNAARGVSTPSGYDNEFRSVWEYSSTGYQLMNPNNFQLKVSVYIHKPIKNLDADTAVNPVSEMSTILSNSNEYPGFLSGVRESYENTLTSDHQVGASPTGFTRWSTERHLYPKHLKRLNAHFKSVRQKTYVLAPGDSCEFACIAKYGMIYGDDFDSYAFNPRTTKFVTIRVETPLLNTNDPTNRDTVKPACELICRIKTKDVLRYLPTSFPQHVLLKGSNPVGYDQPTGVTAAGRVPAGRVNALVDGN